MFKKVFQMSIIAVLYISPVTASLSISETQQDIRKIIPPRLEPENLG